jgi:hypothetical protein
VRSPERHAARIMSKSSSPAAGALGARHARYPRLTARITPWMAWTSPGPMTASVGGPLCSVLWESYSPLADPGLLVNFEVQGWPFSQLEQNHELHHLPR